MKNLFRKISIFTAFLMVVACNQQGTSGLSGSSTLNSQSSLVDPQKEALVSFKLTDAPNKSLKSVYVNVDHMEVLIAGSSKAGRVILAQGLGVIDLLQLQNGVTLPLQDIVAPAGLQIQQIRLILKESGHYAVKEDDSICEMKTPSAQKTGVKIILTNKVQFEAGHQYNIVVDFDALKSVVVQGNGRCLLKPVLKLKSAYKSPLATDPGTGSNSGGGDGGSDVVTDPGAGTGDSDVVADPGTGAGDSGGGEELVTNPDANTNDPSTDDGWDSTTPGTSEPTPILPGDELYRLL